jgi:hypothetical protein
MSKDRGPDSKECNADLRSNTTQPGPQQPDVIAILTEFDDLAYRGNHGMVVRAPSGGHLAFCRIWCLRCLGS